MSELVANGVRLAYDESGDGEPIVFVGGTGMPAVGWEVVGFSPQVFVDAGYRVVTFDSRGVGRSDGPPGPYSVPEMAADTAELIEQLDLAPCRLVGLSLGGSIVEELCCSRPELVRSAVLWASAGPTTAFIRYKNQADLDLQRLGPLPSSYYVAAMLTIALPFEVLQNDDTTVTTWAELLTGGSTWSGDGQAGQLAADFTYALDDTRAERWPAIQCPCLIVAHEHDLLFPPRSGRVAAAAIPHGEFLEVPGVAHGDVTTAAETVRSAVLEFFTRT